MTSARFQILQVFGFGPCSETIGLYSVCEVSRFGSSCWCWCRGGWPEGSSGEEENEGDLDENDEQKPFTVMKANLGFDQMEGISEFLECLPREGVLR
ncbi:hypothetical protein HAX54_012565 [Datura stramonium]|uniref:Uncharacterized protein n=1 Tax=Datura stramonium TaxID=4076 RepID=A0ABS8TJY3_DATST|nr:hypothetical protein [Datura stramonium]